MFWYVAVQPAPAGGGVVAGGVVAGGVVAGGVVAGGVVAGGVVRGGVVTGVVAGGVLLVGGSATPLARLNASDGWKLPAAKEQPSASPGGLTHTYPSTLASPVDSVGYWPMRRSVLSSAHQSPAA